MEIQTDAEHVQELRDSAAEAQAARNEVITEIARLTTALRQAEAERAAARADAERLARAIEIVQASNGYGLDVPEWYGDDDNRDWIINAGAVRACAAALAAHRAASGKAVTG